MSKRNTFATLAAAAAALLLGLSVATPVDAMFFGVGFGKRQAAATTATTATTASTTTTTFGRLSNTHLPPGARRLTGEEVFRLYSGRTWVWGEGGGYFGPYGRFLARTVGETGVMTGGGTWGVNNKGRVCFRADWSGADGIARANTCFDHMVLGADIYQRKAPDGDWYVFRHGVADPADESSKLVGGDLVSPALRAQ